MKTIQLVAATVLAVSTVACASASITGSSSASASVGAPVADGWYPGEKLFPARADKYLPEMSMPSFRRGTTPEGYVYTIYPDGSGSVDPPGGSITGGWSIDCTRDAMTDKRECKISSTDARLLIFYGGSASPQNVCIIGHDFPGRSGMIRVDAGGPVNTDKDGCTSGRVAKLLAAGSSVTTRRVEWPYDYSRDQTSTIAGAKAAMDLVDYIRANVDKIGF